MKNLEEELEKLYLEKSNIEERIAQLESLKKSKYKKRVLKR